MNQAADAVQRILEAAVGADPRNKEIEALMAGIRQFAEQVAVAARQTTAAVPEASVVRELFSPGPSSKGIGSANSVLRSTWGSDGDGRTRTGACSERPRCAAIDVDRSAGDVRAAL